MPFIQRNPKDAPAGAHWQLTVYGGYTYYLRSTLTAEGTSSFTAFCEDDARHMFDHIGGDSGSGYRTGVGFAWCVGVHEADLDDVGKWIAKIVLFTHDPDQDRPALCASV